MRSGVATSSARKRKAHTALSPPHGLSSCCFSCHLCASSVNPRTVHCNFVFVRRTWSFSVLYFCLLDLRPSACVPVFPTAPRCFSQPLSHPTGHDMQLTWRHSQRCCVDLMPRSLLLPRAPLAEGRAESAAEPYAAGSPTDDLGLGLLLDRAGGDSGGWHPHTLSRPWVVLELD